MAHGFQSRVRDLRRCAIKRSCCCFLVGATLAVGSAAGETPSLSDARTLPDAPSTLLLGAEAGQVSLKPMIPSSTNDSKTVQSKASPVAELPPCPRGNLFDRVTFMHSTRNGPCRDAEPLQFIVDPGPVKPLSPEQKGMLAVKGVIDPFNLITIVGFSGISVAANSHSAYGPGFDGWGRLIGYSLAEDIQGEFTGTFLIPVLAHEDPRYHRMGAGKPFTRRFFHSIVHTYVSQHDDGSLMPNYATLINYPLSAEISNLYVPGVATNAPSTFKRVAVGILTDPTGAIVAEFLPDVAKRIHIHVLFAQQILNRIALGSNNGQQ